MNAGDPSSALVETVSKKDSSGATVVVLRQAFDLPGHAWRLVALFVCSGVALVLFKTHYRRRQKGPSAASTGARGAVGRGVESRMQV